MASPYEIIYETTVVREDLPKLSSELAREIKRTIEEKLIRAPEVFGKPLRYLLKGARVLRVGDYRVGFKLGGSAVTVFAVVHRSIAYREMQKRL